jgi:hypothetical protein
MPGSGYNCHIVNSSIARENKMVGRGGAKMKKMVSLLVLVCTSASAESFVPHPVPSEGCIPGVHYKKVNESRVYYHRSSRHISKDFSPPQEVQAAPGQFYTHQTASMQPYFSGFCNPAFPSSCPR